MHFILVPFLFLFGVHQNYFMKGKKILLTTQDTLLWIVGEIKEIGEVMKLSARFSA